MQITSPENRSSVWPGQPSPTLNHAGRISVVDSRESSTRAAVRRLTPRECERLQGFPDDWTLVPYRRGLAADGPRYRAIGNSMATVVVQWIGRRIDAVNEILRERTP